MASKATTLKVRLFVDRLSKAGEQGILWPAFLQPHPVDYELKRRGLVLRATRNARGRVRFYAEKGPSSLTPKRSSSSGSSAESSGS